MNIASDPAILRQTIDRYFAVWNEPDPATRAALLAEIWSKDAAYIDPTVHAANADQLLTHIALLHRIPKQIHQIEKRKTLEGFNFPGMMQALSAEEQQPRTKAQIIDLLTKDGDAWAAYLEGLSDDFLAEEVRTPPGMQPAARTRFEMLLSPKEHEMHHRGQLMLIQRMLGLTPHLTRQMQERMAAAQAARA